MPRKVFEDNCINFLGGIFLENPEGDELRPAAKQPKIPGVFITESKTGQQYKVTFSIEEL